MVKNEENYQPIPVYNRKMVRTMLKAKIYKRDHAGENKKLKEYFNKYRTLINNTQEEIR